MPQELLIAESSGLSMVGSWHHELLLTLCADGTCSLRLRFQGDANSYRPRGIRGIRTANQLMGAIDELREMSPVFESIDFSEVCKILMPYRPNLAKNLMQFLAQEAACLELPIEIESKIAEILNAKSIYPKDCRSLIDRRLMWEEVRQALVTYFMKHNQLPERAISIRGHIIQTQ